MAYHTPRKPSEFLLNKIKNSLQYFPQTGELYWIAKIANRTRLGERAGVIHRGSGYYTLTMTDENKTRRHFQCQHICWYLHTGEWPQYQIDHINTIRIDNSWENLREDIENKNSQNRSKLEVRNTSGVNGVRMHKRIGKYQADIRVKGKLIHLGYFDNIEEATAKRKAAEKLYHGDFAASRHNITPHEN